MKILLTDTEKRKLLTDSMQHLAESLSCWEFKIDFLGSNYDTAQQALKKNNANSICIEDILTEIVFGGFDLKFIDSENEENIFILDLNTLNENLDKCNPLDVINIVNDGDYDFWNTDSTLQTLVFGEVVFS